MDWSIQEVARFAGTTSRTLRHYDDIGLLAPSRIGPNGYRRYDQDALVRLQRILLLRDLGLSLAQIAGILDGPTEERHALETHLGWLRQEQDRLARRIASVEKTIESRKGGESLMAQDMFDGFAHTAYEAEVTERWGAEAYERGDDWWRGMSDDDRSAFRTRTAELTRDWTSAAARGIPAHSDEASALAERHVAWLRSVPGTPSGTEFADYVAGLGEMYVADPRFARTYATEQGGTAGAEFVRDALRVFAATRL